MMGRYGLWIQPGEPDERITRAEWAGGILLAFGLVAIIYGAVHATTWLAPLVAGR